jgi:phosphoribosylaminoimidazole-succinocarboxamide synthase
MATAARIEHAIKQHMSSTLFSVEKPTPHQRGKVRDMFFVGDHVYMVNTDRISAFDQVLGTIPLKGALLCEQAEYWFKLTKDICPNHLLDRPDPQIMVCKKAQPFMVEVIVRGFLAGSLMRENPLTRGAAYGVTLDPLLKNYQKLNTPIITPTTKAELGAHDQPISAQEIIARGLSSPSAWLAIVEYATTLFSACSKSALEHGLLLVDTKYEFGLIDGKVHLIDEVHTSDSSRFFITSDYDQKMAQGETPLMLDKEYLRQHLMSQGMVSSLTDIRLDDQIRAEVAGRYFALTEKITNQPFNPPDLGAHERVHQQLARLIC